MAISVGRGVLRGGRERKVHEAPKPVPDGAEIVVFYRPESGPPGLGLRIEAKRAMQPGLVRAVRWDVVFEWAEVEDVDGFGRSRSFRLRPRDPDGVDLRAVVHARAPAEEDRTYTLNVSVLDKTHLRDRD